MKLSRRRFLSIALLLVADPGSAFGGWTGCSSPSGPTCTVTSDGDKAVESVSTTGFTITALIDGRSQLIVQGNTATWRHLDYAAPWRFRYIPTTINSVNWLPTWTDVPNAENRNCNCYSSTFISSSTLVPQTGTIATLNILRARGSVSILQQPTRANNYTLIIDLNDDPIPGGDYYTVHITFKPNGT
jgi:hypothetical protein